MARIFSALAVFSLLLLLANIVLGFALGDLGASARAYELARREAHELATERAKSRAEIVIAEQKKDARLEQLRQRHERFQPHFWLGIASSVIAILVNCVSVTYFIGTSRWCQEVVTAYGLNETLVQRSRQLKRRSFPFAFLAICTVLVIASLGAASDPGASLSSPASWVLPHLFAAMAGTAVIAVGYYFQAIAVGKNYELIQQILDEAERVRESRLDACPSA